MQLKNRLCHNLAHCLERALWRALGLFLVCIASAVSIISPANARQAALKPGLTQISSDSEFAALDQKRRLHTLIHLIQTGRHTLAERLLDTYPMSGKLAGNRTLFLQGMILKAQGDLQGAVDHYRAALAADPGLSLVRMELAHTLFLLDEDTGAKHHLELLQSAAPTIETSKQFDRFIDNIDARRPWAFSAYVSLAPSTNFNNGTSEQIIIVNGLPFTISGNSREKSGIGLRGGANASYSFRLGKDLSLITGGGINFSEYEGNAFDDMIFSQSIMLQKKHPRGRITAGVVATQRWTGTDEFSWSIGPQVSVFQRLAPKLSLYSKLRHTVIDYEQADYRSGHKFTAEHRLGWSLADGTIAYLIGGGERSVTDRKHLDYWAGFGGLGLYYEAPYGITLYAEAELRRQIHDGRYPVINEKRKDTRADISVSVHKRDFDIFGVTPQLHYSYIHNFSNSPIDRYETHGANVTLTKKF